jgi:glycosyltransferase involved in cell wall biosynthesis
VADNKKTILLLSDHPLSSSGVGTQARWLINGLINTGKWKFKCFGGAVKHDDYRTVVVNEDFIIKPTNGFGDRNMLRQVLVSEKPDVLLLFTDPRFFIWVWEMEDEIHQVCPIAYNHLWDNHPWPEFNRVLYESTDLVNCINWPTYTMVKERFPEKTNYIPHAIPQEVYYPLPEEQQKKHKVALLGSQRADHFTALFVSRNARRKMPSDILISWKQFIEELKAKHNHTKATLIMHTEPLDPEGPNLHHVVDMLGIKEHVFFSKNRIEFQDMNKLYNAVDTVVNRSCNEGFGLSTLEGMMCGKPIIAIKTGGLTRQVEDLETGEQFGIGLDPDASSLVGNQMVPYIYEDYITHENLANAFMQMYDWGPEKRKQVGNRALEHAKKDYNVENLIKDWDNTLTNLVDTWHSNYRSWEVRKI